MNETQNICFWLKEVVTHLIKNSDMAEKEHWWREESITACPKEEDPIFEDSKKTLSLRTLKRMLSMRRQRGLLLLWNLKTTLSMEILKSFRTFNDFCAAN